MTRIAWQLFDPLTNEQASLSINPNEGGTPTRRKNILTQTTTDPDGATLVFEGRDEVQKISFSGVLLTQEQVQFWDYWFTKRRQIRLTDDLGRQEWIYITSYDAKRVYSSQLPWRHTFTVEAMILDLQ